MKTLIVYYTSTGNTEKVVNQIQKQTGGVIEKIEDNINRKGVLGFLKSGLQAARKSIILINEPTYNPSDFDQIIIVSSIWNGTINSPMRTYLEKYKKEISSYKLVLVRGGIEIEPVVSEVINILGKSPIKVLGIKNKEIKQNTVNLEEVL